jgi:hypothetical protein
MKKRALVWVALAAAAVTGCGNGALSESVSSAYTAESSWDGGFNSYDTASSDSGSGAADIDVEEAESSIELGDAYEQKLIRTYTYNIETLEYDASMALVEQKVAEYGGYIEYSESSGSSNRYASLTLRIPAEKSEAFLNQVGEVGEIIYRSSSSEDVTTNYYDTTARLTSLNTQHERLLELLEKAQSLDDIVALNSQLTEVEYEIDRYTTMLRVYDNKVDYVTINLTLREVQQIQVVDDDSFWTQVKKGITGNTADVLNGLMAFVIFLITGIPYFIVIGIVLAIAVFVIKKIKKASTKKLKIKKGNQGQNVE